MEKVTPDRSNVNPVNAPQLTTTSYAILGLLHVRPYSAYELATQSERSLRFVWPTAPSRLYAEPKRLCELGLAEVRTEPAGPTRTRQVFRITRRGRAVLRAWLRTDPQPPRWEMEALVRTLVADAGRPEDLLATMSRTAEQVGELYTAGLELLEGYRDQGVAFPERMHLNMLWIVFVRDLLRLIEGWTRFVEDELGDDGADSWQESARAHELLDRLLAGDDMHEPRRG